MDFKFPMSIIVQQDATMYSLLYFCKLLLQVSNVNNCATRCDYVQFIIFL